MIAKDELDEAIRIAGQYLIRQCRENGQFKYRVNLDPSVEVRPRYNLVRHAGAIYALTLFSSARNHEALPIEVSKACNFLRSNIAPISHLPPRHAVWSQRRIEGRRQRTQCKLGAAGLALVALSLARNMDMRLATTGELAALAEFVLFMQKKSGKFFSKYYPKSARRSEKWTSLYYPGEAALGLLMAHQHIANPQWLLAAERALSYLAKKRQGRFPVAPDHWALIATAEYFRMSGISGPALKSHVLMQHAIGISESMLYEQQQAEGACPSRGWFTPDARTTPTATRIEGLLAVLRFLPESMHDLRNRITLGVARGIQLLLRAQIRTGPFAGGIPREVCTAMLNALGTTQSRSRATEIRIDYVQHALCALIQLSEAGLLNALASIGGSPLDFGTYQIDVGRF